MTDEPYNFSLLLFLISPSLFLILYTKKPGAVLTWKAKLVLVSLCSFKMASPKMKEPSSKFPEGDADSELNPGKHKGVEVDPKESEVTSLQIKQRAEANENKRKDKKKEKSEPGPTLKTTIVVSGMIVALIGAIFTLTKKLKEK